MARTLLPNNPSPAPAPPDQGGPAGPTYRTPDGMARAQFPAMGTTIEVLLPRDAIGNGAAAVRALFERWEGALSRFRPESELSRLNQRAGQPVVVGPLLAHVLGAAMDAAQATGGLYDPTLLPHIVRLGYDRSFELLPVAGGAHLGDALGEQSMPALNRPQSSPAPPMQMPATPSPRPQSAYAAPGARSTGVDPPSHMTPQCQALPGRSRLPSPAATRAGDTYMPEAGGGWRAVSLDRERRQVTMPAGVQVDLGGIAKGMAADEALERLRALGVEHALVNAGGDLAVYGTPPGMDAWPIAVVARWGMRTVPLRRGAMATSGIARRRWQQGAQTRHHILDPRTGLPAMSGLWSVSVVAARCMQAEVAAKAAFILGLEAGAGFLLRRGLVGMFVLESGEERAVGSWPARMEAGR